MMDLFVGMLSYKKKENKMSLLKLKNNNSIGQAPISECRPNVKRLKEKLVDLKYATKVIYELIDNNYIDYDCHARVIGRIQLQKRDLKEDIKRAKQQKKNEK